MISRNAPSAQALSRATVADARARMAPRRRRAAATLALHRINHPAGRIARAEAA